MGGDSSAPVPVPVPAATSPPISSEQVSSATTTTTTTIANTTITLDDVRKMYRGIFAPAIDRFLETTWYTKKGLASLLADQELCARFAELLERSPKSIPRPEDAATLKIRQSLETDVIWSLMGLCRSAAGGGAAEKTSTVDDATQEQGAELPAQDDALVEALQRFDVVERLFSSLTAENGSIKTETETESNESAEIKDDNFWGLARQLVRLNGDDQSKAREDLLWKIRPLLDKREQRDIIYSIGIVRQLRSVIPGFPLQMAKPTSDDEKDPANRLLVARVFLERETVKAGTFVCQRLCAMAVKTWSTTTTAAAAAAEV